MLVLPVSGTCCSEWNVRRFAGARENATPGRSMWISCSSMALNHLGRTLFFPILAWHFVLSCSSFLPRPGVDDLFPDPGISGCMAPVGSFIKFMRQAK